MKLYFWLKNKKGGINTYCCGVFCCVGERGHFKNTTLDQGWFKNNFKAGILDFCEIGA